MNQLPANEYGHADATFQAAGGEQGICNLVNAFYDLMDTDSAYVTLRGLHPTSGSICCAN